MFVDCEQDNVRGVYELLISAVVPRPIAWVSTRSEDGVDNLAPFSFFNVFSAAPPILGFAPGLKRMPGNGEFVLKDTLKNIIDTEEFVVNMVSADLAQKMVQSSANYAADESEFDATKLARQASLKVKPPRVADAKISMECKLFQIIDFGASRLVLGRIVCIHVDESIIHDGQIDNEKLRPVARLGGDLYAEIRDIFSIPRPTI
ncbi:MAG: flavin reductase family protein [Candidatus Obscuribacterales bacterium]|nr:flavin reductase family protein [Candidatus Obscuribacterales bacterium]